MNVPLTPVRCLYRAVDLYPQKTGVVCGPDRFTYREFGERCERLAAGLLSQGVRPGDRVALLSFNNHQLLEAYFGPLLIRAISMPLNVRLTAAELIVILNHATPRVLMYEPEFAPLVAEFRRHCSEVRRYVAIGEASGADLMYEAMLRPGRLERPDPFLFDEDSTAELFYTSGSTGTPKGVMLSHRNLYLQALEVSGCLNLSDRAIELQTIPLFHANGWSKPQAATMVGATHVMVRRFEPATVLRLIEAERATAMSLVPVMANALLNAPELGRFDTSSLEEIELGGAASSPDLIRRLEEAFHCHVFGGYGLTETSPVATFSRHKSTVRYRDDEDRRRHRATAGWPVLGCEVRVVDAHLRDVPRDNATVGEVVMRGDNVMQGYFREPEATAAAMTGGWFHSGDMAVWDAENYIQIVDRQKDIIISGGENISSIEIERAIALHPAVYECAVVAAPDDTWGEVPAAIVVLQPGAALDSSEMLCFLRERLAKFKLPRLIEFREEPLPKTGTGKILKRELREAFWQGKTKRVQGG